MKKKVLFFTIIFFCHLDGKAQLYTKYATVGSIDSLVQAVFGGSDVQIFNVKFVGDFYPLNSPSAKIEDIGYFNSEHSTVGIKEGIALTGGKLDPLMV